MAEVDPGDDAIRRFVVSHYRYDAERNERRNVVMAAFDNEAEYLRRIDGLAADLKERRLSEDPPDPRERISGVVLEPGHRERQQNARLLLRAIRHRAATRALLDLPMPPNVGIATFTMEEPSSDA